VMSKLPLLMGAVKKIKEDEKAKIPPPPKDARLGSGGGDEFDDGKEPTAGDNTKKGSGETPELSGPIPEYVPLRFIDVDLDTNLVGDATFEYRLRMVLFNPNHKRESEVAAPDFAKDEFLFGTWSNPARVTFEPDQSIYAGERERPKGVTSDSSDRDKVPVQLIKWLGKVEHADRDRSMSTVGDWWVENLLIGRGEYIARSPEVPGAAGESNLIYWVSHALDTANQRIGADVMKKARTYNLMTDSLLVDFHGGAYQSFQSDFNKSTKKDDVPAELLILEPDGRLVARHLLQDKNDPMRKAHFEHWTGWVAKLKNPEKKAAAAGAPAGNSPLGGKGGSK
ncbi:MAG TPA: hypothetical protein PLX97_14600, partial [Gemmatales bacterium]|nr:hypothetical protein [Gemmatales bacterium]